MVLNPDFVHPLSTHLYTQSNFRGVLAPISRAYTPNGLAHFDADDGRKTGRFLALFGGFGGMTVFVVSAGRNGP